MRRETTSSTRPHRDSSVIVLLQLDLTLLEASVSQECTLTEVDLSWIPPEVEHEKRVEGPAIYLGGDSRKHW